jgi:hypothetical protein
LLQFSNLSTYPMLWKFWKKDKQKSLGVKQRKKL